MAKKPVRLEDRPAMRDLGKEAELGAAIRKRVLVKLRYKDDVADRLVAPHGVFFSSHDKTLLVCTQIENPGKPLDRGEPRYFEVGLMSSLSLTDHEFRPDPRFDPSDVRYENGFLHRV